jgi:hypothetical protein
MSIQFRPLGKIREMIQSTGLDISHFYDDLVICDFSVFIIKFDNYNESRIHLYFNEDCEEGEKARLCNFLLTESRSAGLDLIFAGSFMLEPIESAEEIKISFYQTSPLSN